MTTDQNTSKSAASALVADIKRNSLDDGPGIRSVVFFKGCPLRCVWCQNPETLSASPQIQILSESCLGCGACRKACPEVGEASSDLGDLGAALAVPKTCTTCGTCVDSCPSGARRLVGTEYGVDDLADRLRRDKVFYKSSGGGVTFSGGEPTLHMAFAGELSHLLKQEGIEVLLETSGFFSWDRFSAELLPNLSTVYFDLKLADPELHRRYTGQDNARIVSNLEKLAELARSYEGKEKEGFELLVRVPLVPEITAQDENLEALAALVSRLGLSRVALLPYNPLWVSKRRALGFELSYTCERWMSPEEIGSCRRPFERAGLVMVT